MKSWGLGDSLSRFLLWLIRTERKLSNSKFKSMSLMEALQVCLPLTLSAWGICASWVLHLSAETGVTSLQLPRCHYRIAMLISRYIIWTYRGEMGDHSQHKSQEYYRNSHKIPNPPELPSCTSERGAQLSIINRTPRITSADSSGIQEEGQNINQSCSWPFPIKMLYIWSQSINCFS